MRGLGLSRARQTVEDAAGKVISSAELTARVVAGIAALAGLALLIGLAALAIAASAHRRIDA